MSLSITNESKNDITITNEDKPTSGTWEEFAIPWEDANSSWSSPGLPVIKESKNNITITNENKN